MGRYTCARHRKSSNEIFSTILLRQVQMVDRVIGRKIRRRQVVIAFHHQNLQVRILHGRLPHRRACVWKSLNRRSPIPLVSYKVRACDAGFDPTGSAAQPPFTPVFNNYLRTALGYSVDMGFVSFARGNCTPSAIAPGWPRSSAKNSSTIQTPPVPPSWSG